MIGKLVGGGIQAVVYVSAASFISMVIMLCYVWSAWHMDRGRVVQMLAIAQGLDLFQADDAGETLAGGPAAEQPSMEQVIEARLAEDRDLKMREMALQSAVEQLQAEQRRLVDERAAYQRLMETFQTQMAQLKTGAEAEGRTKLGATLESIEPDQAKTFLLDMLDKDEIEEVVILLANMEERKRAGLIGEFQTPDEIAKIADVLRLIRQGHPEAAIADEVSLRTDPGATNPL